MSSAHAAQSETARSVSAENAPQVVVRAGKYFVCTACGTLVELPPEVIGQLVITADSSQPHEPIDPSSSREQSTEELSQQTNEAKENTRTATRSDSSKSDTVHASTSSLRTCATKPPRPKRPKQPGPRSYVGEMIDGLRVPSAGELDRAFNWVSFHLMVLDRQNSEIKRLQKQCQQRTIKRAASTKETQTSADVSEPNFANEVQASKCSSPTKPKPKGREPP